MVFLFILRFHFCLSLCGHIRYRVYSLSFFTLVNRIASYLKKASSSHYQSVFEMSESLFPNQNIAVLGSQGMLGAYVSQYLKKHYQVVPVDRTQLDAETCTTETLRIFFQTHNPTVVINCIGKIPQRSADKHNNTARSYMKINGLFPRLLADLCHEFRIRCIHISTDCVFTGQRGNYLESDTHDETSLYGFSKSFGEDPRLTIIRTSIIGEERSNKKSLLEWVLSSDKTTVFGYTNHYWNGVTCLQLAKSIEQVIRDNLWWSGVRHIHSPKSLCKQLLIREIAKAYHLSITVMPMKTEKTVDKCLFTEHKESLAVFRIPSIEQQIQEQRQFFLLEHTTKGINEKKCELQTFKQPAEGPQKE